MNIITRSVHSCLEELDICVEEVPLCDMDALHAQLMHLQVHVEDLLWYFGTQY
jgi:hypothetical protein